MGQGISLTVFIHISNLSYKGSGGLTCAVAEMLGLLFPTGPQGSAERGSADRDDGQAGEQSDRAPAREPRAVQPGPQPYRGCRGHPGLSTAQQGRLCSGTGPQLNGNTMPWGSG